MAAADPVPWQPFFATIAGSAAALIGLLFVGLSLHLQAILADDAALARARETLGIFLGQQLVALLLLIPGQRAPGLGGELLLFGLLLLGISRRVQHRTRRQLPPAQQWRHRRHSAAVNLGAGLIALAGASLLLGRGGGLYWLAPSTVLVLGMALVNAWMLTVNIDVD
jgi:modulator of FtsH protease